MNDLVSIIIVNWNGKKYLKTCLETLYSQNYKNIEVIVVDNASTDRSAEFIKKHFSKAKIIENKKNLGFAEANNIGYRKSNGEYVLFLNNDTYVTKNFLTELIIVLKKNTSIGGAQSKILLMDEPGKLDSVGAYLTSSGFLYHYGVNKENSQKYSKQIYIYSAKGACMIFKKGVMEKVKVKDEIFDSRYFAYFEETDLCHRVWLAGYKIVFAPKSIIYHKVGGTSTFMDNTFIQYHSFKNRLSSYLKNFDIYTLIRIIPPHIFLTEIHAFAAFLKGNLKLFMAIQKALLWNIKNIKQTLDKRSEIQKNIRKIGDKSLYPYIAKPVKLNYYYHLLSGLKYYKDEEIM